MILCLVYSNKVWIQHAEFSLKLHNKVLVQTFRCAIALWKSWVCKYSIRFQVIKLKLLCETLKNEKWKILAWYPNKMWYRQRNPKCCDWGWMNFQMQVALRHFWVKPHKKNPYLEESRCCPEILNYTLQAPHSWLDKLVLNLLQIISFIVVIIFVNIMFVQKPGLLWGNRISTARFRFIIP